ncbi:MAG: sigma-70 family RNA polymerase sigma factor [Bacteroidota bacterium]
MSVELKEEAAWLAQLAKADRSAMEKLYEQSFGEAAAFVRSHGGSREDAEDVFQEVIIVLFRRLADPDWRPQQRLEGYVYGIARNLWYKTLERRQRLPQAAIEDQAPISAEEGELYERSLRERLLGEHLLALPSNCQEIMKWFLAKTSLKEIAKRLNSTVNYIKKRKHHCQRRLIDAVQADPRYQELEP